MPILKLKVVNMLLTHIKDSYATAATTIMDNQSEKL